MHRGQQGRPCQAPRGLATSEQGSGLQGSHTLQTNFASSNKKPDPFALNLKQPFQSHIDGYFATTASGKPQQQRSINPYGTVSEYFTENKENTFPGIKDPVASYDNNSHNISDGFEDLNVQMTEMHDSGDFMTQTVPSISSAKNTLSPITNWMLPQHEPGGVKGAPMPRVNTTHDSGGPAQRVPVLHAHRGTVNTSSNAVRGPSGAHGTGIGTGAEKNKDPTTAISGGIHLRSIYYATSVQQVLDGSMHQSDTVDDGHRVAVVLVEVIGTLCTPMLYEGFCWNFSVRDPTRQDYLDKHPLSPPPSMTSAPLSSMRTAQRNGPSSVPCQLFDMGNALNLEILEQGELIRIVGIVSSATKREWEMEKGQQKETKLLSVACRRATADEARLTIEGSTRCPPPKSS